MGMFDSLKTKLSNLLDKNSDQTADGSDTRGDAVDSETAPEPSDKIATGESAPDSKDDDLLDREVTAPPEDVVPSAPRPDTAPPAP